MHLVGQLNGPKSILLYVCLVFVFVGSKDKRNCLVGNVSLELDMCLYTCLGQRRGSGRETRRQYEELNEKIKITGTSKKVAEQNILNNGKCNVKHFEPWGGGQRWWWM